MNRIRFVRCIRHGRALSVAALLMYTLVVAVVPAHARLDVFFDENGNGSISIDGGPLLSLPGHMEPDPSSGMPALTYHLPETVINGDVAVLEPDGQTFTDGLRFTNAAGDLTHSHVTADRMIYFSEQPDPTEHPPFDLADTGFPTNWGILGFNGTLTEVGVEGNDHFDWFPGGGNTYHGISDTPEPGTVVLLATGMLGMALYGWRRHRKAA